MKNKIMYLAVALFIAGQFTPVMAKNSDGTFSNEEEFLTNADNYRKDFYRRGWISFTPKNESGWCQMIMKGQYVYWQNTGAVMRAGIR
jgi:hypothetical protein